MRVIFLDVNGVLNSFDYYENMEIDEMLAHPLDPRAVKRLAEIVRAADAKIVLTSSIRWAWHAEYEKRNIDCKQLTDILAVENLEVYDVTPKGSSRPHEIRKWLRKHPFTKYVIVDDSNSKDWETYHLTKHLVKTNIETGGLTDELTKEAIKIIKG